jgi:Zn-dependent M28 family amino/carboxypeptidase
MAFDKRDYKSFGSDEDEVQLEWIDDGGEWDSTLLDTQDDKIIDMWNNLRKYCNENALPLLDRISVNDFMSFVKN